MFDIFKFSQYNEFITIAERIIAMTDIKKIMQHEIDNQKFTSGVNLLVLVDGKEVIYEEYGYRDAENKVPFSRDTITRLYSMSKPVTAAAAMILADRGLLDLGACLCWTMPGFSEAYYNIDGNRVKATQQITVKDLLNMTSGIPYPGDTPSSQQVGGVFWELNERLHTDNPMTTAEFARRIGACDLSFNPGDRFMYGASADVLGALIEQVSGMTLGEFMKKEIFEPLGMNDTGFYVKPESKHRLAKVYRTDYANWCIEPVFTEHLGVPVTDTPPAFESGGAGLYSTLDDYAKFATMLMNGGELNGKRILSQNAVNYLTSPSLTSWQIDTLSRDWRSLSGYSYGNLMRNLVNPGQAYVLSEEGEYGWDGWLGCFFANYPKSKMTILMTMQRVDCGTAALTRKLINAVRGELVK